MEVVLEAKGLRKTFILGENNKHDVLKNIDLQIKRGEFVAVMGPSGSGKSTLLYNVSGMDKVTSGSVMFNAQELTTLTEKELSLLRLHEMGFVFQHIHLLKDLTLYDNIILSAYLAKKISRKQIHQTANSLMEKMGIVELANNDITQASGGQLQRVAICRAMINEPKIIFGDEPTGALNSRAANDIMEILADVNEAGTTIVLVTHDMKVAAKTDRVLYMLDGRIIGDLQLGKWKKEEKGIKEREEIVTNWLQEMGF